MCSWSDILCSIPLVVFESKVLFTVCWSEYDLCGTSYIPSYDSYTNEIHDVYDGCDRDWLSYVTIKD